MSRKDWKAIESALRAALSRAQADGLPDGDVANVADMIEHGEAGLALDILATQIHEYDVDIDDSLRAELRRLGQEMGVAVDYLLGDPWADPPANAGDQ